MQTGAVPLLAVAALLVAACWLPQSALAAFGRCRCFRYIYPTPSVKIRNLKNNCRVNMLMNNNYGNAFGLVNLHERKVSPEGSSYWQ